MTDGSLAFPRLQHPIIGAPMAGGPSTPALAAAISEAGGFGFLAAGYRTAEDLRAQITGVRGLTRRPFGVNLFCIGASRVDDAAVAEYANVLQAEADRLGVALGRPRFEDDDFDDKLEVVLGERPEIVSFTFGCPSGDTVGRLHEREIGVWVTITDPTEAEQASRAGVDGLIAQGVEAGGHRGSFADLDGSGELSLLPLLRLTARVSDLPLIASGGIADGSTLAAVLVAGARAAQIGTAFLRCPEAGTSEVQREAVRSDGPTALTRAFTGRRARGIVNRFMRDYGASAPSAYPHVHHLTAPLRAAARKAHEPDPVNLWAGEAHSLAQDVRAGELVVRLADEARQAMAAAAQRLDSP